VTASGNRPDGVFGRSFAGSHRQTAERRTMDPLAGRIELSLPADSRYMRLARLMASGVATTCGLPLEEVEDFRIAVDELCATLIEMGDGHQVELRFELGSDALEVVATTAAADREAIDEERLALSRQILDVVTDGHDLSQAAGSVSFRARKLVRGRGVG
jgi:serine/threonine-protein kinase RsbW